jgi:hypothetical protein
MQQPNDRTAANLALRLARAERRALRCEAAIRRAWQWRKQARHAEAMRALMAAEIGRVLSGEPQAEYYRAERDEWRQMRGEALNVAEAHQAEVARLRAVLQSIAQACESGDIWEHGIDGDEYNSWTTCEGRWAIHATADETLKASEQ